MAPTTNISKVRGYFVENDHPAAGKTEISRVSAYKFTESPFTVRRAAAPAR